MRTWCDSGGAEAPGRGTPLRGDKGPTLASRKRGAAACPPLRTEPAAWLRRKRHSSVGHRIGAGGMNCEYPGEAGDLKDLENVAVRNDKRQLDLLRRKGPLGGDEDAERARVDERALGEIHNDGA